ncbi:TolC family protein [Cytophaga sp. FL35]|uniref:TolC family protein n=1 Tax=Cytophaga sp. FL35 TaxID=1904456 RepID=UPI0025700D5C|nr:TolC family protein [Cytophaga sp. FL35]
MKINLTDNTRMAKYILGGTCSLLMIFSCVPSKPLAESKVQLPESFTELESDTVNSAQLEWRDYFSDPQLISLIDSALAKNQELNIMMRQINIANNEISERKGEYLPFVGVRAGAEVEKVGEFTRSGAVEKNLDIREGEEFPEPLTDYSVGLFATWELDIWKKLRNAKKAAVFEYLATVEGKNFMVTQLISEIAESYFELLALDNQLDLIDQNLEIQDNALRMVRLQKQAARTTELAVRRFEAEVLKNRSHRFEVKQRIIEVENEINLLVGRIPEPIQRNSSDLLQRQIDTSYAGVPSQLLQNRPDIKKAEYELAAAELSIKEARANFFPSLELNAGVGLQAFDTQFLNSTPESLIYSVVGDVVGPLINRRAIKAHYNNASERQVQAVFEYEKAVLQGYVEVVNQLSKQDNLKKSYDLKSKQVDALNETIDYSTRLFRSARAEYIEVLLAQREALDSKMELVETKKEQLIARVNLYKALGGGWN